MNRNPTVCNDEQLSPLLYADEGSAEYENALQHVEQCDRCRSRLEQLAATKEMWQQSQTALCSDEWMNACRSPPAIRRGIVCSNRLRRRHGPSRWRNNFCNRLRIPRCWDVWGDTRSSG